MFQRERSEQITVLLNLGLHAVFIEFCKKMGNFCKVFAACKQIRDSTAFLYRIAGILLMLSTTIFFWYLSNDSVLTTPKAQVVLSNGICLTLC